MAAFWSGTPILPTTHQSTKKGFPLSSCSQFGVYGEKEIKEFFMANLSQVIKSFEKSAMVFVWRKTPQNYVGAFFRM